MPFSPMFSPSLFIKKKKKKNTSQEIDQVQKDMLRYKKCTLWEACQIIMLAVHGMNGKILMACITDG